MGFELESEEDLDELNIPDDEDDDIEPESDILCSSISIPDKELLA